MPIITKRLGGTEREPISLEISERAVSPTILIFWLERLPGLRVIAKKSWALTDDFEAYFIFRDRLFVVCTPSVDIWVSILGQPADERLFDEIEAHIGRFSARSYLFAPIAIARYLLLPFNPPKELLARHGQLVPGE